MAEHIMVVDDEAAIADLVEVYLRNDGNFGRDAAGHGRLYIVPDTAANSSVAHHHAYGQGGGYG